MFLYLHNELQPREISNYIPYYLTIKFILPYFILYYEFYRVCARIKLKVNVKKSRVMLFERREVEVVDFNTPYRVSVPAVGRCEIVPGEKVEEVRV